QTDEWNSLVPDLVLTMTCAPPPRPNSAEYEFASTLNSCIESRIGRSVKLLIAGSLLSTPSRMLLFAVSRAPAALKPPRKLSTEPGAGELAPGTSCTRDSNCLLFNGSSTTL